MVCLVKPACIVFLLPRQNSTNRFSKNLRKLLKKCFKEILKIFENVWKLKLILIETWKMRLLGDGCSFVGDSQNSVSPPSHSVSPPSHSVTPFPPSRHGLALTFSVSGAGLITKGEAVIIFERF